MTKIEIDKSWTFETLSNRHVGRYDCYRAGCGNLAGYVLIRPVASKRPGGGAKEHRSTICKECRKLILDELAKVIEAPRGFALDGEQGSP